MGEYPHCFAACLGQVESLRLVLSKGVDPNATDLNGNNVLHLMVIKDKIVSNFGIKIWSVVLISWPDFIILVLFETDPSGRVV